MFNYAFTFNKLEIIVQRVVGNLKAVKKMFRTLLLKTFGKIPKGSDIKVVITKTYEPMFI